MLLLVVVLSSFSSLLGQENTTTAATFETIIRKDNNYLQTNETRLIVALDSLLKAGSTTADSIAMFSDLLKSKVMLAKEEYSEYISFTEGLAKKYKEHSWLYTEYSRGLARSYFNVNLFDKANAWNNIYRQLNEEKVNNEGKIHLDYTQPGIYYFRSENYEKALEAFKANFAEIENDDRIYDHYKGNILNNISITFTNLGELDSAEYYNDRSREYWSLESPDVIEDRDYLLGLLDGNLATIELKRGNYKRAKELLLTDINNSKEKDYWNHLNSRCEIIGVEVHLNELQEARESFDLLAAELDTVDEPAGLYRDFIEVQYELLKAEKRFEEALKVHEELFSLRLDIEKRNELAKREQTAVLYDLVAKENLLKEQEIQILEQADIKERNKQLWAVAIGLIIIGVLLIVTLFLITQLKNRKISAEKERQENIKQKIELKDLMMREMHHRIKNNLQTVSGLFRMQIRLTKNPETVESLKEGVSRVNTITEIHNLVFEDGYEEGVNANSYLNKIVERLKEVYTNTVQIKTDIEPVELKPEMTVPVGLILNELITNSVKYAFKNENSPQIDVKFYKKNGKIVLHYADNGSGYEDPESADGGLGLTLIELMAKQLKADIHYLVPTRNKVEFIFE